MADPTTTCPTCGSAVRLHTGREGTCSYEPAALAEQEDAVTRLAQFLYQETVLERSYPLKDWHRLARAALGAAQGMGDRGKEET